MANASGAVRFAPHKSSVASLKPASTVDLATTAATKPPRPRSSFSSDLSGRTLVPASDPPPPSATKRPSSRSASPSTTTPALAPPPIAARVRDSDRPKSFAALRAKFGSSSSSGSGSDRPPARFPSTSRRVSAPPLTSTPPPPLRDAVVPVRATPSLLQAIDRVQQAQHEACSRAPAVSTHDRFWRDVERVASE